MQHERRRSRMSSLSRRNKVSKSSKKMSLNSPSRDAVYDGGLVAHSFSRLKKELIQPILGSRLPSPSSLTAPLRSSRLFVITLVSVFVLLMRVNQWTGDDVRHAAVNLVIVAVLYWFSLPFDDKNLALRFSNYFYASMTLILWLGASLLYHLGVSFSSHKDSNVPIGLFLSIFFSAIVVLSFFHWFYFGCQFLFRSWMRFSGSSAHAHARVGSVGTFDAEFEPPEHGLSLTADDAESADDEKPLSMLRLTRTLSADSRKVAAERRQAMRINRRRRRLLLPRDTTKKWFERFARSFKRYRSRFRMELIQIMQNSFVVSLVCCVFFDACGNTAAATTEDEQPVLPAVEGWTTFLSPENVCHFWLEARSAKAYHPFYSVLSMETLTGGTVISPVYSVFMTFVSVHVINHIILQWKESEIKEFARRHKEEQQQKPQYEDRLQLARAGGAARIKGRRSPSRNPRSTAGVFGERKDHVPQARVVQAFQGAHRLVFADSCERRVSAERLARDVERQHEETPLFQPMTAWWAVTSSDLWVTIFQMILSIGVFLDRYDMRIALASTNLHLPVRSGRDGAEEEEDDECTYMQFANALGDGKHNTTSSSSSGASSTGESWGQKQCQEEDSEGFWFDFMADTGDGGDSTYAVLRSMAQPRLHIDRDGLSVPERWAKEPRLSLPRGRLLVCGGDMAYPNPSHRSYKERLSVPFEYAMSSPRWHNHGDLSVRKPDLPRGLSLGNYSGPQMFTIPGNHDWFDGLSTFTSTICHGNWLGGWLLPQKKPYFSLKLPCNWWLFGFDLALSEDLDILQFKYFVEVTETMLDAKSNVICLQHVPNWTMDAHKDVVTGERVRFLINRYLKGRCRMRLAGDLHHYMRHDHSSTGRPGGYTSAGTSSGSDSKTPTPAQQQQQQQQQEREEKEKEDAKRKQKKKKKKKTASLGGRVSILSSDNEWVAADPDDSPSPYFSKKQQPQSQQASHLRRRAVPAAGSGSRRAPDHLVVSGGGGAFLHPTHMFASDLENNKDHPHGSFFFNRCFPSAAISANLAARNLTQFRYENWRFDLVGVSAYFMLSVSMIPFCHAGTLASRVAAFSTAETLFEWPGLFVVYVGDAFVHICMQTYVSAFFLCFTVVSCWVFTAHTISTFSRVVIGLTHAASHFLCAMTILLLIELTFNAMIARGLIGIGDGVGSDSLFQSFWQWQDTHFPDPYGLRLLVERYSLGLYPGALRWFLNLFDLPQAVALLRHDICTPDDDLGGEGAHARFVLFVYHCCIYLYYFVMSAPVCSFVFGAYLWVCLTFFGMHYDEGFSSLRNKDYKNFLKFRIDKQTGDLECFCVGFVETPVQWVRDADWDPEHVMRFLAPNHNSTNNNNDSKQQQQPPSATAKPGSQEEGKQSKRKGEEEKRQQPSQWKPHPSNKLKLKLIDYFRISSVKGKAE